MARYFCRNCGKDYSSIRDLTSFKCPRSPLGAGKGPHELYEGSEKDRYTCKYCGKTYRTIMDMTLMDCPRHPSGLGKGKHSPAL